MPGRELKYKPQLQTVLRAAAYLIGSYFLLKPILIAPIVGDDLVNPFSLIEQEGPGLPAALRFGWNGAVDGASFRILGNTLGNFVNWLWITLSVTFDISIPTVYGVIKFVVFIVCASSIARFWFVAAREYGSPIRQDHSLVFVSLALFGTLQIHGFWSNDPVGNYPMAGYAAAAFGFAVLAAAVTAIHHERWRWYISGSFVAAAAVLYYEINIGAVLGAGIIFLCACWSVRADKRRCLKLAVGASVFVGLPAFVILLGRSITGDQAESYGGTTVRMSGAARTFGIGIVSSLPGAAWRHSLRNLGGHLSLVFSVFVIGIGLLLALRVWATRSIADSENETRKVQPLGIFAVIAATTLYAMFAIALQAITVKVQDETIGVGYVYTAYAMSSAAIALALAAVAHHVYTRQRNGTFKFVCASAAIVFVFVQSTFNWRLSEQLNAVTAPSGLLVEAFDSDVPEPSRCKVLVDWTNGGWPIYYEETMTAGLQRAYRYYFGEEFCKGFVSNG